MRAHLGIRSCIRFVTIRWESSNTATPKFSSRSHPGESPPVLISSPYSFLSISLGQRHRARTEDLFAETPYPTPGHDGSRTVDSRERTIVLAIILSIGYIIHERPSIEQCGWYMVHSLVHLYQLPYLIYLDRACMGFGSSNTATGSISCSISSKQAFLHHYHFSSSKVQLKIPTTPERHAVHFPTLT
jgi:hypothetical protein